MSIVDGVYPLGDHFGPGHGCGLGVSASWLWRHAAGKLVALGVNASGAAVAGIRPELVLAVGHHDHYLAGVQTMRDVIAFGSLVPVAAGLAAW